jgi:hypothetical protein
LLEAWALGFEGSISYETRDAHTSVRAKPFADGWQRTSQPKLVALGQRDEVSLEPLVYELDASLRPSSAVIWNWPDPETVTFSI